MVMLGDVFCNYCFQVLEGSVLAEHELKSDQGLGFHNRILKKL